MPLQDAYSSTTSTNLPPNRNGKIQLASASGSTASSSCTTPSTTTNVKISSHVAKISHHTSPPTAKELAYLEQDRNVQYEGTSRSFELAKNEEPSSTFGGMGIKIKQATSVEDAVAQAFGKRETRGRLPQNHDNAPLGLPQHPKMRVVHPPRGAHHMYSTASSSSSSLSSSLQDAQRESTATHVRKRNYIIFDENDEDTLI